MVHNCLLNYEKILIIQNLLFKKTTIDTPIKDESLLILALNGFPRINVFLKLGFFA